MAIVRTEDATTEQQPSVDVMDSGMMRLGKLIADKQHTPVDDELTAVTGDPKRGCSFDRGGPFDVPGRTSVCGQFSWIKKNLFLEIEDSIFRHLKIDFETAEHLSCAELYCGSIGQLFYNPQVTESPSKPQ